MILRNVQYYQTWVLEPEAHAQLLTAMCGFFSFERCSPILFDGQRYSKFAHHWLLQLVSGLDLVLEQIEDLSLDRELVSQRYHLLVLTREEGSELAHTCDHLRVLTFMQRERCFEIG